MTLADEAAELTEREAELAADEATDAAEDTALEAEEAAELEKISVRSRIMGSMAM